MGGGYGGVHIGINRGHYSSGHYKAPGKITHHKLKHRKHGHHYKKKIRHKGHCGPRRALNKAWRLGLNRPHIARLNKKRIVVVGYNYGHAAKVVFKRHSHHCKVIKTRGLY